jgi:hypothetical protein
LVNDRMGITGAQWGLAGAETILNGALRANDDFEEHWRYHVTLERHRVHESRYLNNIVPLAA